MGTDRRDDFHRGPCKCGKGTFEIISVSPDHSSGNAATSRWFEFHIKCEDCKERYKLDVQRRKAGTRILLKDKTTGDLIEELPQITP